MKSDITIAREFKGEHILNIATKVGLTEDNLSTYGKDKAKIINLDGVSLNKQGKLVLVTAISPTAAGEGKTTVSIGLADGLSNLGQKVCLALREPSLGPVFGVKGGACGGGYSQVIPMEEINLHFTGDFHAITAANNLLSSLIDNHMFQGNVLELDENAIYHKRCLDVNDRALRRVNVSCGRLDGVQRNENFVITAASEVMAILCLASDMADLKKRLGNIIVGLNKSGEQVFAKDLKAADAMALLLKDAIKPNLVQTLYKTPCVVHGGPFANIAHGCNSIIATKTALNLSDIVVTEAGFGADLGGEKFLDFKCRTASLNPSAVVIVATIRALKMHGGVNKDMLAQENVEALKIGSENLLRHIDNIKNIYSQNVVVTINKFYSDTANEVNTLKEILNNVCVPFAECEAFSEGASGGENLAKVVLEAIKKPSNLTYSYDLTDSVEDKIYKVASKIYRAKNVVYSDVALKKLSDIKKFKQENLPIIIAKTQYSFSDNAKLLNAPVDFTITIDDLEVRGGAGFIVAVAGKMMLMPGLSKEPASSKMTIDEFSNIEGLS